MHLSAGSRAFFNIAGLLTAPIDIQVGMTRFTDDMGKLRIGEVAKRTGLRASAIRYYEAIGLVARARRSSSGYRQYGPHLVRQLEFVQLAQGLGLSLDEVQPLVRLLSRRRRPPAALLRYGERHLALAQKQIRELKNFRGGAPEDVAVDQLEQFARLPAGERTEVGFAKHIRSLKVRGNSMTVESLRRGLLQQR